jgi:hypothetical protein
MQNNIKERLTMKSIFRRKKYVQLVMICLFGLLMLSLSACGDSNDDYPIVIRLDPVKPWTKTATSVPWLTANPFASKHDGGWVYSDREERLYAMYGQDNNGQTLYRIDPIGETSEVATTFLYGRHGAHPVIDDTGTYIYMPPSESTNQLERYNTVTDELVTLAAAPFSGTFSHGAWKNDKLWIVLDDDNLYSYDPASNSWSAALYDFGDIANVATSGPKSDLIYVIYGSGNFYSYDITAGTVTTLTSKPTGFNLGGNAQFTWFGRSVGFIYAAASYDGAPAIYDIANDTWHELDDPHTPDNYAGHATYDATNKRLYIIGGASDDGWYYQF